MECKVIILGQCYTDESLIQKVYCEECSHVECILNLASVENIVNKNRH